VAADGTILKEGSAIVGQTSVYTLVDKGKKHSKEKNE